MAQGFVKHDPAATISAADSASVDAFSRWRVSQPVHLFDCAFNYGLAPLRMEPIVSGSGATITHDTTNRCALMTFASTPTGGKAYMQSYQWFTYQPGRSQLTLATFNMIETKANCLKFVGLSDGTNGIELQQSGSTAQFVLYSGTGVGNQTATQANWNLDKLDGTGASGLTLDLTKIQILVIDFQALYAGRVRIGFDIGGKVVYAHQFLHANLALNPYIQYATLPIRWGMTCTGTVSTTMKLICCTVSSEGGQLSYAGRDFSQNGNVSAGSATRTHLLSIRPKATFNTFSNRIEIHPTNVALIVTGANPVYWELCLGQAISGTTTFADVNTTYSGMEFNTAGTVSGSPAIVITSGYVLATNQQKGDLAVELFTRYPITLDAAGAARANGTLSLVVTGVGGASQTYGTLSWNEVR